jgi:hypothetical protein
MLLVAFASAAALPGCGGDSAATSARRGPVINTYVNGRPAKGSPAAVQMMEARKKSRRGPQ